MPGVPRMADYVKDDRGRKLLALQALSELGRLTAGPPGIPDNVLSAERTAMTEVMRDPAFLADAKKLGLPIDYLPGDMVEARMKAAMNQPAETIDALKKAASGGG
jgi:tripartite-type tricarboxylate transporter receptor subunit TctC